MNKEKIRKNITKCRKNNNLTQMQLTEKLNITDRAISKWENGSSIKKYFIPFLSALPSVLIGALIMHAYELSINIWIQNILCLVVCSVFLYLYISRECNIKLKGIYIVVILNILLLCSSFYFEGVEGVKRWSI